MVAKKKDPALNSVEEKGVNADSQEQAPKRSRSRSKNKTEAQSNVDASVDAPEDVQNPPKRRRQKAETADESETESKPSRRRKSKTAVDEVDLKAATSSDQNAEIAKDVEQHEETLQSTNGDQNADMATDAVADSGSTSMNRIFSPQFLGNMIRSEESLPSTERDDAFGASEHHDILSSLDAFSMDETWKEISQPQPESDESSIGQAISTQPDATMEVHREPQRAELVSLEELEAITKDSSASEDEAEESVQMAPLRLKRRKGRIQQRSIVHEEPMHVSVPVDNPDEIKTTDPYYDLPRFDVPEERPQFFNFISFGCRDDQRLNLTLNRIHRQRVLHDFLVERQMRCSGILQNDPLDRPELLQSPLTPVMFPLRPRMTPNERRQVCRWIRNPNVVALFHRAIAETQKWHCLRPSYGIAPKRPIPSSEFKAVTYSACFRSIAHKTFSERAFSNKLSQSINLSKLPERPKRLMPTLVVPSVSEETTPFVSKTVSAINPELLRLPQEQPTTEPEPQPNSDDEDLQLLFQSFDVPVIANVIPRDYRGDRRTWLIEKHIASIAKLLEAWAQGLEYIDKHVRGGSQNLTLPEYFYSRFKRLLEVDYEASFNQGIELPDWKIRQRYALDDLDMFVLWVVACDQLAPEFKLALRMTWDQQTVTFINTAVFLRFLVPDAVERHEIIARLSPSSPMVLAGLFRFNSHSVPGQPLYYEILISEQLLRQFSGIQSISVASTAFAELQKPHFSNDTFIAADHDRTLHIIENFLKRPKLSQLPNLERENLNFSPSLGFTVEGIAGSGRATFVKIIASQLDLPVIIVQCSPLTAMHVSDCEDYLKSVFNDASLMNAILCLRDAGPMLTDEKTASIFARQLAIHPVICAFCIELAVKIHPVVEPYIIFKAKMDANLRDNAKILWQQHLALPGLNTENVDVTALSERIALQPFQIQKAAKYAYYAGDLGEALNNRILEKSAAKQVSKNIGNLAFVSDPEIDLSDVIVSEDIMASIQKIIGSARNRRRVLYEWGLSKRIRRGTGVIALFDGDPGTGKTHSAEAIAHELGLSLMRINIATMVDKYVGETEKNLTTIFEQARPDMQLLLFDEADSLFTKRTSNVSKSNDRYSNMSVNVLLQLVERYEGVSILTTNLKNAIDPAFERRITYKVYFPMPKKKERERLWKYMCPPEIVTAEPIDYEWLSELEMSGGEIKNAVLTAAFNAATQGQLLNTDFLYDAGVAEASAAGRVMRRYNSDDDGFN